MKQRPIRILTCALLGFCAPLLSVPSYGQDTKAPAAVSATEKEAIAAYTKSMKEGEKLAKENSPDPSNPAEAMALMDKMEKIIDSVETEGLPADLGKAFGAFRGAVKKMIAHVGNMPLPKELLTDQAKLQAWAAEQAAADPNFLAEFQAKMAKFQEGMETITKEGDKHKEALDAVHKKLGIEVDLDAGKDGAKKAEPAAEAEETKAAEGVDKEATEEKPKSEQPVKPKSKAKTE